MTCEVDGERASPIPSAFPSYRIQSTDVENPLFPLEIRQFNQRIKVHGMVMQSPDHFNLIFKGKELLVITQILEQTPINAYKCKTSSQNNKVALHLI